MSFRDFFSRKSNQTLARERAERELRASLRDGKPLETQFRVPLARLRETFTVDIPTSFDGTRAYPYVSYQEEHGVKAFVHWQSIEMDEFPRYINAIRAGCTEVEADRLHYQRGALHSFVSYGDELAGRNVFVLSNDVNLIERLAPPKFSPSPPWVLHYAEGPFMSYNQGAPEYWHQFIWLPFWLSISLDEQAQYLERQRAKTKDFIDDEAWCDWVYSVRRLDPRTRDESEKGRR